MGIPVRSKRTLIAAANDFHPSWHPYYQGRRVQFLIIIPSRDIVAVANAWNVFGTKARNVFTPLVEALLKDDQP